MTLESGSTVARKYRIIREIGEGGMGVVYEAINTSTERRVALKVMNHELRESREASVRFIQEAVAVSRVDHPGIVQIFDAEDDGDDLWIAMELLQGETLGQRLERGPLTRAEIDDLFGQLLDVLAAVHRESIVHRDLKPDNVFLSRVQGSRPGAGIRVKLLDFGIAKLTDSRAKTRIEHVMGSWQYMAPEQAMSAHSVDHRADIYALGVMLYQCLSGRLPHEATTFIEQFAKMAAEAPAPLDCPPEMRRYEEVALACLALDPGARPADCAALGQRLLPITVGSIVGGHYKLVREVGAGGMGRVYEAVDVRNDQRVALKLMSDDLRSNADACRRFVQEALAASKVPHPDILQVHDAEYEGRHLWIAMELLEGENLRSRLDRGPLTPDELRALFTQLLDVLDAVHRAGIIHRDLKPENIFLARTDASPSHVKLLDFGVAKLAPDNLGTRTGYPIGTFRYMAPEQAQNARKVDARADIYALGVILYECLSGKQPFESTSLFEHFGKVSIEPPMPIEVEPALEPYRAAALACITPLPAQRPADCAAIASMLGLPMRASAPASPDLPTVVIRESMLSVPSAPRTRTPHGFHSFVATARTADGAADEPAEDGAPHDLVAPLGARLRNLTQRLRKRPLLVGVSVGVAVVAASLFGLTGSGSTRAGQPPAIPVAPARTTSRLVAGGFHTCALLSDGQVKCWGHGQLGYRSVQNIGDDETPASVGTLQVTHKPGVFISQLAAGNFHTCALLSDRSVGCWGVGAAGQLGLGNVQTIGDDEHPSEAGAVSVVGTPSTSVTQLAAGGEHTCALLSDGAVKCWGRGEGGRLGYGNTKNVGDDERPSEVGTVGVSRSAAVTVTQVVAGAEHTCVLLSDRKVRCWGYGSVGQLGYGNTQNVGDNEAPAAAGSVVVTRAPNVSVTQLVAGGFHTCALLSNGEVTCWGRGEGGRLGYGHTKNIGDNERPADAGTVRLTHAPGVTVTQLSAGTDHTCALLSDGQIKCWGQGHFGQLGYGNTRNVGDDEQPADVGAVDLTGTRHIPVVQLVAGGFHTCALLADDTVRCWGDGEYGQLGYGNTRHLGDDESPSSASAVRL